LYDTLADKLELWMRNAETELDHLTPLGAPGNLRKFWELKAQFEVHNHVVHEATNAFEQAMHVIPVSDEDIQRQLHAQMIDR